MRGRTPCAAGAVGGRPRIGRSQPGRSIVGCVSSQTFADPSFAGIAAVWTPDGSGGYSVTELTKLAGDMGSVASAINNLGDMVGYSQGQFQRAVWFNSPSGLLDLTPTGAFRALDVNDQRIVACYKTTSARLDLNTLVLQELGAPAGSYSNTLVDFINESNQVAGVAILATSTSCNRQVARYGDATGWEVFGTCGPNNGPGSLNDVGDMTMVFANTGYVRLEGIPGIHHIEDMIDEPVGNWITGVLAAGRINNGRQIAIFGQNPATGQSGTLLLSPLTTVGSVTCAGDGSAGACPCGNASESGLYQGCAHSGGIGARLFGSGSSSVASDDLTLQVVDAVPSTIGVLLQGGGGAALPFFDGLRCASQPLKRLQVLSLDATGGATSSGSIVAQGQVVPGDTRVYQAWFRDVNGPCGASANVSSGLSITWN